MTEVQEIECSEGERFSAFLAGRLGPQSRQSFLAHLGLCEHCASLLRDLREDERLARMPLTAEERSQIQAIVRTAREEVQTRLEDDRRRLEESRPAQPQPLVAPPGLLVSMEGARRALWLAAAAASMLAAAGWWLFGK